MEEKDKNLKSTILGWTKLRQYGPIEVWKTPTMFLACDHYRMIFRFTSTLKSAIEEVKNIKRIS